MRNEERINLHTPDRSALRDRVGGPLMRMAATTAQAIGFGESITMNLRTRGGRTPPSKSTYAYSTTASSDRREKSIHTSAGAEPQSWPASNIPRVQTWQLRSKYHPKRSEEANLRLVRGLQCFCADHVRLFIAIDRRLREFPFAFFAFRRFQGGRPVSIKRSRARG